jgi:HK97 family phage major capsid protein
MNMRIPHNLETRSAPLETRADPPQNDDPLAAATAAVEELRSAASAFETRQADALRAAETRIAQLETRLSRPTPTTEERTEPSAEVRAFGNYLRMGSNTPAEELRTLTISNDPTGGYLAPAETGTEFIRNLVEFSPIRSVASVRTIGAPSVKYPKRTGISNAQWEGETEEAEASEVTFGMLEIPVHGMRTFVELSNELLADAPQAEQEVRLALSEDFGAKEALAYVNGSGAKQPEGFMQNAAIGHVLNGHAANLSADALISLLYALPAAYRNRGHWALNGTTLATVRKLKDGQGNYLWQPAFVAGQPETILGRPVVEMKDMPDIAANAFPIIYGDFSAYRIVDRLSPSIMSDPYTQAHRGVTRLHAFRRTGGRVMQPERFKKLKMATN